MCEHQSLTSEITKLMFTHQNQIFRKTIFRPLAVLHPQISTRARKWPSFTSAFFTKNGDLP